VCIDNVLVITTWSPIHLRDELKKLYWKADKPAFGGMAFWEDTLRYLYLPRLRNRNVLEQAIIKGAGSRDFFGTAYGQQEGKLDGFKFGDANVQLDDTLLLIEPDAAEAYEKTNPPGPTPPGPVPLPPGDGPVPPGDGPPGPTPPGTAPTPQPHAFHGNVDINASTAKMRLVQVAEEIIAVLATDPAADVKITLEIQAGFPSGASDQTKRAVMENAKILGFKNADWE